MLSEHYLVLSRSEENYLAKLIPSGFYAKHCNFSPHDTQNANTKLTIDA